MCNDTMVENPIIATYVDEVLKKIERLVKKIYPYLFGKQFLNSKILFGLMLLVKDIPYPTLHFDGVPKS